MLWVVCRPVPNFCIIWKWPLA